MSFKPTLISLILALITGVAAFVVWRGDADPARANAGQKGLFDATVFPTDEINIIRLTRGDEAMFVFERDEAGWMQTEPFRHPVDDFSLGQLVQVASKLRSGQLLSDEDRSPASLGLEPPRGVVEYRWDGGGMSLALGRNSIGGRAYLRVGTNGPIHVVNADLHDRALDMDPREWRLRRLFTFAGPESTRVTTRQGDQPIILERDRRTWKMTQPLQTRVDEVRFVEFLAEVNRAQHSGFILDQPDDLTSFGLHAPAGELRIETPSGGQMMVERLLIGAPTGLAENERYAMVEGRPTVIKLNAESLRRLFPEPETFVSLTASGVQPANVKTIQINGPEGEFRLERRVVDAQEQWVSLEHGDQRVPQKPVATMLEILTQFQATGMIAEPYQQEHEVAVISLFGYDGNFLDAVRISRPDPNGDWFLDNGDGLQRLLPPNVDPPVRAAHYGLQPLVR